MDVVGKLLLTTSADYSTVQILAIRGWIILLCFLAALPTLNGISTLKTKRIWHHCLRSLVGFGAPLFFFMSIKLLPLADATAGFFSSTFIAVLLSAVILKERVTRHSWYAATIGFIGVLLVLQPGTEVFRVEILFVLASATSYAIFILMGRWMSNTESTFTLVFYTNLIITLLTTIMLPFFWKDISLDILAGIALMALLGIGGQLCLTHAFRLAPVGIIAPIEYSGLIWATLFGFIFWNDVPGLITFTGMGIIMASGIYLAYKELQ